MADLLITNKTLTFAGTTWQLSNITKITKYALTKEKPFSPGTFIGAGMIGLTALFYIPEILAVLVFLGSAAFVWYAIKENKKPRTTFGLKIETTAGSSELFASPAEHFIDKLILTITDVMQRNDQKSDIQVNIDNMTIFDRIRNSTIVNQSNVQDSFKNWWVQ